MVVVANYDKLKERVNKWLFIYLRRFSAYTM